MGSLYRAAVAKPHERNNGKDGAPYKASHYQLLTPLNGVVAE
jgi:hypothetical protein